MFYIYIIYSKKLNKKYIGYCENLKNRLREHNSGESKFTSRGVPWSLVYYQVFLSEIDARKEERFLKSGKGRDRLKFLLNDTMNKIDKL
ncbi:MAG: GIY-YIG nuclease family protein [Candidatus Moranbacteria bacterium]|nr:GIY-YIG nuclease family protein [Candidatus Moranbacteria bacterium]